LSDNQETLTEKYTELASLDCIDPQVLSQIDKDVPRTFPKVPFFREQNEGPLQLSRLLKAFANFDPQQGYVQGMNSFAGSLLFHGNEVIAFWSLVALYERLELRNVFLPGFPSIKLHIKAIESLMQRDLPLLAKHMADLQIEPEILFLDWFVSMGSAVIPLQLSVDS
jgi:Rab-GTPase-TBC domain